jgi:hypothetical protein
MKEGWPPVVSKLRQSTVQRRQNVARYFFGKGSLKTHIAWLSRPGARTSADRALPGGPSFQSPGDGMKRAFERLEPQSTCSCERNPIMRPDLVPGAVFPDLQLPDHTSTLRRLGELQADDPLILTLSRGHYCPKEHQQHLELAAFYPKIAVAYTQIATISTDDHHTLQEFRASVGAQWTFLSDQRPIGPQNSCCSLRPKSTCTCRFPPPRIGIRSKSKIARWIRSS